MYEKNSSFDIDTEFTDIRNEHREPFKLCRQQEMMEKQIRGIFIKFIPELAKNIANGLIQQMENRHKKLYDSIENKVKLRKALITIKENEIKNDFKSKIKGDVIESNQ